MGNALFDFERHGTNVTNKINSNFSQSVYENAFNLCFPFMGPVNMEKTCPWIGAKVTGLPELPWMNQLFLHFLKKLGEPFTREKKMLPRLEQ